MSTDGGTWEHDEAGAPGGAAKMVGAAQRGDRLVVSRETIRSFSHRLRSMLTSVGAAAEYMLYSDIGPDVQTEMLGIVAEQTNRIHGLLDDLMVVVADPAEPDTGSLVDLHTMARRVVRELVGEAQSIGAWLVLDTGGVVPPVLGDLGSLQQAVTSTLRSVMAVARAGERVVVMLEPPRNSGEIPAVEFAVALQSDDDRLQERAEALTLDNLSLDAARRICQRHGGGLTLMSDRPGVVCALPAAPIPTRPAAAAGTRDARPMFWGA